ncbi:MAG TPA: hypothetical protein VIM34_23930 [Burkholderiaceae bacterium]
MAVGIAPFEDLGLVGHDALPGASAQGCDEEALHLQLATCSLPRAPLHSSVRLTPWSQRLWPSL